MATRSIVLVGSVGKISPADASRLAAYVARGRDVLAQGPVHENGTFRINLVRSAFESKSPYGLKVVIAPAGAEDHLEHVPGAVKIALDRSALAKADKDFRVAESIALSDLLLKKWWRFCVQYCIHGTLVNPNGCPVPGADVTVYTVRHTLGGYTKTARATVTTAPDGTFTACFPWCRCALCFPCWPCWPLWWNCWPWWWEFDILHVIEAIERQPIPVGPGPVERASNLGLFRPDARALMRGEGFCGARKDVAFVQDSNRTALIKSKLANSRIRALFPWWWWWCCDDPNIAFSASQNGTLILDENPTTDTRWCFEEGSSVTLLASEQAITACPPGEPPESGFAWTRVGLVTVDQIVQGYTNWWGGDAVDAAFGGNLDIYGAFALGANVAYYQVEAGQWTGDPSRGGIAPAASSPLAADLYNYAYVYDSTATLVFSGPIKMGPFNQGGLVNLYATQEARQSGPTPPGLVAFPVIPPGGFVLWAYADRKVYTSSSTLVGGSQVGAVDLTLVGYDGALNPVALVPDAPLTIAVDNTDLSAATVGVISAFRGDGSPATLTNAGECPAYDLGPGGYVQVPVTITDTNGHLYAYYLAAEHGHGISDTVTPPGMRAYVSNPLVIGPDPSYAQKSWVGGTEVMTYYPPVDCCYEFRIRAGKRITDGYGGFGLADRDFRTISLKVT